MQSAISPVCCNVELVKCIPVQLCHLNPYTAQPVVAISQSSKESDLKVEKNKRESRKIASDGAKSSGRKYPRCPHGRLKSCCKPCGGKGKECPHGKRSCWCAVCNGTSLCKDPCPRVGKRKYYCSNCRVVRPPPPEVPIKKPYPKCPHGGRKSTCKQCDGVCLCKAPCVNAGRLKHLCCGCGGQSYLNRRCASCQVNLVIRKGVVCYTCAPVPNMKAKEREARMAAMLVSWAETDLIPVYTSWNRQNPMADPIQCGKYRPDFIYELQTSIVFNEFDENQHSSYTLRCELVRMAETSLGYGGMPVHWVRYNPDSFRVNGKVFRPSDSSRHSMLLSQLQSALGSADYDHFITITYICYSLNSGAQSLTNFGDCSGGASELLRVYKFKTVEDYMVWVERRLQLVE